MKIYLSKYRKRKWIKLISIMSNSYMILYIFTNVEYK